MVVELGKTPSNEVRNAVDVLVGALEPDCELSRLGGSYFFSYECLQLLVALKFLYFRVYIILISR